MKLEAISGISMCDLRFEVRREVDDVYGAERALFDANAASYTKSLGDERYFRFWCYFDAQLASADNRTRLFALLTTLFGLALVVIDYSNSGSREWSKCEF